MIATTQSVAVAPARARKPASLRRADKPAPKAPRLRLRPNLKQGKDYRFHDLPFIGSHRLDGPCWDVPATGGYFGGYQTGKALAQSYLKLCRDVNRLDCPTDLTGIVKSFMRRYEASGGRATEASHPDSWPEEFNALRGQWCGFFNELETWLIAGARRCGGNLDLVTHSELVAKANAGLLSSDAEIYAEADRHDAERAKGGEA